LKVKRFNQFPAAIFVHCPFDVWAVMFGTVRRILMVRLGWFVGVLDCIFLQQ